MSSLWLLFLLPRSFSCHSPIVNQLYLLQAAWATHIELSRNKVRRNDRTFSDRNRNDWLGYYHKIKCENRESRLQSQIFVVAWFLSFQGTTKVSRFRSRSNDLKHDMKIHIFFTVFFWVDALALGLKISGSEFRGGGWSGPVPSGGATRNPPWSRWIPRR